MGATVFRDCTLLDCTGAGPAPRSTVVVDGERIVRVVRGGEPDLPHSAERIDCGGRTLMPGLTDARSRTSSSRRSTLVMRDGVMHKRADV